VLATKETQLKLAADLQARADRVNTEIVGAAGLPGATHGSVAVADPEGYTKQRLSSRWDLYEFNWKFTETDVACTNCSSPQTGVAGWFAELLHHVRPHYGELDVKPADYGGTPRAMAGGTGNGRAAGLCCTAGRCRSARSGRNGTGRLRGGG